MQINANFKSNNFMRKLFLPILIGLLLSSCKQEDESKQQLEVVKKNACIINLNQYNTDLNTIISNTNNVYNSNGQLIATFIHNDTLPPLGKQIDTFETERTKVNTDGEEVYVDTMVQSWKRYQFYINLTKNN